MEAEWTTNPELFDVSRAVAHLLQVPGVLSGGVAYLSVLCDTLTGYGISQINGSICRCRRTAGTWT